jgi:hypothetical protein
MLTRLVVERYFQSAMEWLERRDTEDPGWVDAAGISDALVYMTEAELRGFDRAVRALLEPYLKRLEELTPPPEGARPVNIIGLALPLPEEQRKQER